MFILVQNHLKLHRYVIIKEAKRGTLKATTQSEPSLYLRNGTKLAQIIVNL